MSVMIVKFAKSIENRQPDQLLDQQWQHLLRNVWQWALNFTKGRSFYI